VTGWSAVALIAAALAGALGAPGSPARRFTRLMDEPAEAPGRPVNEGLLRRGRLVLAPLAGAAGVTFVQGAPGLAAGVAATVVVWMVCTRAEPPGVRREREAARRGLPHVTRLLAVVLAGGQSVASALGVVADALPGPASAPLARARASLAVGVTADKVWADLAATPGLEPLGRALQRASESGARVADVVARLAVRLAEEDRAAVEDRARTVGIRAAVPLGLCLLPAFLVIGIVPVVAGSLSALKW
jgi:Flp pilus assembly protein TadB